MNFVSIKEIHDRHDRFPCGSNLLNVIGRDSIVECNTMTLGLWDYPFHCYSLVTTTTYAEWKWNLSYALCHITTLSTSFGTPTTSRPAANVAKHFSQQQHLPKKCHRNKVKHKFPRTHNAYSELLLTEYSVIIIMITWMRLPPRLTCSLVRHRPQTRCEASNTRRPPSLSSPRQKLFTRSSRTWLVCEDNIFLSSLSASIHLSGKIRVRATSCCPLSKIR